MGSCFGVVDVEVSLLCECNAKPIGGHAKLIGTVKELGLDVVLIGEGFDAFAFVCATNVAFVVCVVIFMAAVVLKSTDIREANAKINVRIGS